MRQETATTTKRGTSKPVVGHKQNQHHNDDRHEHQRSHELHKADQTPQEKMLQVRQAHEAQRETRKKQMRKAEERVRKLKKTGM